jgi:hypothetical protein
MVPMGAVIGAIIIGRTNIPPIYFLFAGGLLEVMGTAGLSQTSNTHKIWGPQYVFQILVGPGCGFFNGTLTLLVPFALEKRDLGMHFPFLTAYIHQRAFKGVGQAAVAQFTVLGGMAVLAIVTSVVNRWVRFELEKFLPMEQVELLLQTTDVILKLPEATQSQVREVFGRRYYLQMKIMIGMAGAQLPSTLLMWAKKPIMVKK